jgi:hypothetical protein
MIEFIKNAMQRAIDIYFFIKPPFLSIKLPFYALFGKIYTGNPLNLFLFDVIWQRDIDKIMEVDVYKEKSMKLRLSFFLLFFGAWQSLFCAETDTMSKPVLDYTIYKIVEKIPYPFLMVLGTKGLYEWFDGPDETDFSLSYSEISPHILSGCSYAVGESIAQVAQRKISFSTQDDQKRFLLLLALGGTSLSLQTFLNTLSENQVSQSMTMAITMSSFLQAAQVVHQTKLASAARTKFTTIIETIGRPLAIISGAGAVLYMCSDPNATKTILASTQEQIANCAAQLTRILPNKFIEQTAWIKGYSSLKQLLGRRQ